MIADGSVVWFTMVRTRGCPEGEPSAAQVPACAACGLQQQGNEAQRKESEKSPGSSLQ